MFKRGDVVQGKFTDELYLYVDGTQNDYDITRQRQCVSGCRVAEHYSKYTGPIYERDVQRFVPSGEPIRGVKAGDYWLWGS